MAFAQFMATPTGRGIRVVAGIILIALGLLVVEGTAGIILVIVGILPVLAGLLNVCLVAPLIGAPFSGSQVNRPTRNR